MEIKEEALEFCKRIVKQILYLRDKNRKVFNYSTIGLILGIVSILVALGYNSSLRAYEIHMEDQVIAMVRDEDEFDEALGAVEAEVKALYGHELAVPEDMKVVKTKAKNKEITDTNTIMYNIKEQLDMKVKATAIVINGDQVVCLKDRELAEEVLAEIKSLYIDEDKDYKKVGFSEDVALEEVASKVSEIKDKEEVIKLITRGTDQEKIHRVASGESAWTIARKHDLRVADIEAANPGIDPERLQIDQELSLVVPKPYISVQTKEYVELVEEIPFETEYEKTESLYKGDKKITVQGIEGEREIKGYLIKENGVLVDREILQEEILSEPRTRIIAEGTKPRPATVATGIFSRPTRGRLTSGFGYRWGRRHEGIDIANSLGTSISAADAGRVSFAGYRGSYGNLVIINHENGYQTYYAHCSRILVKSGSRVYKGQEIAKVGNTGRSTGPHLHFEVRRNGAPINPLQFVSY